MRKAIVAGGAAVTLVLVAAAFLVAPPVRSQSRSEPERLRDRSLIRLDGRGSAIGVSIRDLDSDEVAKAKLGQAGGVVIERVDEESPAEKAGVKDGDIMVEFDGERVRSARHFARLVQESVDGRAVKATLVRNGARQTVDITPEASARRFSADIVLPSIDQQQFERELERMERGMRSLPRNFAFDFNWDPGVTLWSRGRLGASLAPLTDQLAEYFGAKEGVLVSSVDRDSAAARGGLKAGDVITSINGRPVETPSDVTREIRDADTGKELEIGVLRDRKPVTLKVPTPERPRTVRRFTRPA